MPGRFGAITNAASGSDNYEADVNPIESLVDKNSDGHIRSDGQALRFHNARSLYNVITSPTVACLFTMPQTMKEAIIHAGPKVEIRDVPIPEPGPRQVVIKVVYSGSNPKDW
jgi:hypothetical protein